MRRLIVTLPTPAENLALDEALLDWAEAEDSQSEYLRVWESPQPMVVVGRSTRIHEEVYESACAERGIPVLRRSSGGAAIIAGRGCLMYAIVLSLKRRPELRDIRAAHLFVLGRLAEQLRGLGLPVEHAGTSDLIIADSSIRNPQSAISNKKFSGNSLRIKRTHLLYHGTLLYDFDLSQITTCLREPPRQPEYRAARRHQEFIANLPIARPALLDAVLAAWPTTEAVSDWPQARVAELAAQRFGQESWNREFA